MSTILEALKKSEQERKLNKVPTLSDIPTPQEKRSWPTALLVILIVLLFILIVVLLVRYDTQEQAAASSQTTVVAANSIPEANKIINTDADIVVNVVSYSEQAEQSFVMINGKLFRNGEFVQAGLKVIEIKPDEVVLNYRGRRLVRQP